MDDFSSRFLLSSRLLGLIFFRSARVLFLAGRERGESPILESDQSGAVPSGGPFLSLRSRAFGSFLHVRRISLSLSAGTRNVTVVPDSAAVPLLIRLSLSLSLFSLTEHKSAGTDGRSRWRQISRVSFVSLIAGGRRRGRRRWISGAQKTRGGGGGGRGSLAAKSSSSSIPSILLLSQVGNWFRT